MYKGAEAVADFTVSCRLPELECILKQRIARYEPGNKPQDIAMTDTYSSIVDRCIVDGYVLHGWMYPN